MPVLDFSNAKYSFEISGNNLAILDLTIELQLNAPVQLMCRAVPRGYTKSKVVDSSTAKLFWQALSRLDGLVGKPVVNLSISDLGLKDHFKFDAKGWVLGAVDVSASATAEAPSAINITILHPIVLLAQCPVNVGPVAMEPALNQISGDTYIDVIASALRVYARYTTKDSKKGPAYTALRDNWANLSKYVECRGCSISKFANLFRGVVSNRSSVVDGFKRYILSCIENGAENQNLLSFAMQALASDLSLWLCPDPKNISATKMILKPKIPYTKELCLVGTSSLMRMSSYTGDWLCPSGVYTDLSKVHGLFWNAPESGETGLSGRGYVCMLANDNGKQMLKANIPGWFTAIMNYSTNAFANAPDTVSDPKSVDADSKAQCTAVRKILTQDFLDVYRQTKSIVLERLFSITAGGKLIVPGITCALTDQTGSGKNLLFNVSSVTHQFSLIGNTASTKICGNYVRAGDFKLSVRGATDPQLIKDGFSEEKNYIWG